MSDTTLGDAATNQNDAPQWARDKMSELNTEDAQKRIKSRDLTDANTRLLADVTRLTDEKTNAEKAGSVSALDLLKLQTALAANVPGDKAVVFASRLQGTTAEELKADAAQAIQLFGDQRSPSDATDPSQGQGSDNSATNSPATELGHIIKTQLGGILNK